MHRTGRVGHPGKRSNRRNIEKACVVTNPRGLGSVADARQGRTSHRETGDGPGAGDRVACGRLELPQDIACVALIVEISVKGIKLPAIPAGGESSCEIKQSRPSGEVVQVERD